MDKQVKIGIVTFDLPLKMNKKRFVEVYKDRFGEKTEEVFEQLMPTAPSSEKKKKKKKSSSKEEK